MNIGPGITVSISPATTYTMNYADGAQTFTEPFVTLRFSKEVVDHRLRPYDTLLTGVAALLTMSGAGPLLSLALTVAGHLVESLALNPDGSLTLMISHHYWGNQLAGVDPTAWPIPGLDSNQWSSEVNRLLRSFA